jgi:farnesyl diphosphate synthase
MAGGQMLDIAAEGALPDEAPIRRLQAMKTGALIRFACEAGAILGGAPMPTANRLVALRRAVGLAFQLADDLLDATGEAVDAGKATRTKPKKPMITAFGTQFCRKYG